jgi:hypothetical protein
VRADCIKKPERMRASVGCVPARLRKKAGSLDSAVNRPVDRSAKAGLNPCKLKTTKGKRIEPN